MSNNDKMTNKATNTADFVSGLKKVLHKIFEQNLSGIYKIVYQSEAIYEIGSNGSIGTNSKNVRYFFNNDIKYFQSFYSDQLEKMYFEVFPVHNGFISTREGGRGTPFNSFLDTVVVNIYKSVLETNDINKSIDSELESLSKFLASTSTEFKYYFIITNLELPTEIKHFSLSDNIIVKTLDNDEIKDFYHPTYDSIMTIAKTAIVVTYKDEYVYQHKNARIPLIYQNMDEIVDKVLYSLNLEEKGMFKILKQTNVPVGYVRNFVGLGGKLSRVQYLERPVKLTMDNIGNVKSKYNKLNLKKYSFLHKPLRRLSDAESRTNKEDSIVDIVIGLESILLNNIGNEKERGEMRYRFSTNYASLFGKDIRKTKFQIIRDIYDLRSVIVHSANINPNNIKIGGVNYSIYEIEILCKDILRELINRIINNNELIAINSSGFWLEKVLQLDCT